MASDPRQVASQIQTRMKALGFTVVVEGEGPCQVSARSDTWFASALCRNNGKIDVHVEPLPRKASLEGLFEYGDRTFAMVKPAVAYIQRQVGIAPAAPAAPAAKAKVSA